MVRLCSLLLAVLGLSACAVGEVPSGPSASLSQTAAPAAESTEPLPPGNSESNQEESALKITVGDYEFSATFEDNSSANEFKALLAQGPVTIEMADYGGFEKVGPLGTTLTQNDDHITTQPGDVILYQGNQITIYYGTNSWSFTRLATIDDPTDLKAKLGEGSIQATFSLA